MNRIAEEIRNWSGLSSPPRITEVLTTVDHPPLRYLLSLPGWLIAPGTEWGLRLGAVAFSLVAVVLAIQLGRDLGGPVVGYAAGLFLAASPVFAWISAAFGWSVIVVALLASIRDLYGASLDLESPGERRRLHRVNGWLALAFLTNTGAILFAVGTFLAYLPSNHHRLSRLMRSFAPALAFYCAYFLVFGYLAPWAVAEYYDAPFASGQAVHGRDRLSRIAPGLESFLHNLKTLNTYLLPFFAWGLLVLGGAYLVRRAPKLLLVIAPFALAWSFLLTVDTGQYFLLVGIALVPFGIAAIAALLPGRVATTVIAAATLSIGAWHVTLFLLPYRELEYPDVFPYAFALTDRQPNLVAPYDDVRRDVDNLLGPRQRYVARDAGSLPQFYLKEDLSSAFDSRFAGFLGGDEYPIELDGRQGCYRLAFAPDPEVRLAIAKVPLCPEEASIASRYSGSRLVLYMIRHAEGS